ncbi:hypothetical protein MFLAVUS_006969 [Mucor flavus]|uniref:Uncharacterized protein n=1 Tax=Mucor flavus TaxID=439312 RepID=A0ABP9Z303_9FUNG
MEDIMCIKDLLLERITEVVNDFRTENIEYQLTYNQYLFVCQITRYIFHKRKIKIVSECVRARFELENIQCQLKVASETKRFGAITTFNICKDSERLLKEFEVTRQQNRSSRQDIKEMIKSILNRKEIIDKNTFNQICRFVKRSLTVDIADYTPIYCKKHSTKALSELLDYLLRYMKTLQENCEQVDSLVFTVELRARELSKSTSDLKNKPIHN